MPLKLLRVLLAGKPASRRALLRINCKYLPEGVFKEAVVICILIGLLAAFLIQKLNGVIHISGLSPD